MSTEVEYFEGFKTTKKGRALIAKLLAEETLKLSKVTAGSGRCPDLDTADLLEDLICYEMDGTSTTPTYDVDTVSMEMEFRSDMNGGVQKGFFLYELGVFAIDPDEGEILIYYGSLGDLPNYISAMATGRESTFRYPVSITIGEDKGGVVTGYPASAFVTHQELEKAVEGLECNGSHLTIVPHLQDDMDGESWALVVNGWVEAEKPTTPDPEPDGDSEPEVETPEPESPEEPNDDGKEVMSDVLITVDEEMPVNLKVDGKTEGVANITENSPSKYTIT